MIKALRAHWRLLALPVGVGLAHIGLVHLQEEVDERRDRVDELDEMIAERERILTAPAAGADDQAAAEPVDELPVDESGEPQGRPAGAITAALTTAAIAGGVMGLLVLLGRIATNLEERQAPSRPVKNQEAPAGGQVNPDPPTEEIPDGLVDVLNDCALAEGVDANPDRAG